jgi:hypothetical protein
VKLPIELALDASIMTLSIFQAKWQLGLLRSDEVPAGATALLAAGDESPALIELAGLTLPDHWDVAPLVQRAFEEAGLATISDNVARWRLVYQTAREIIDRRVTPLAGATTLWHLASDLGLPEEISYFVYLAADYGEGPGDPETECAWFDARILETAATVLRDARPDQAPLRQATV